MLMIVTKKVIVNIVGDYMMTRSTRRIMIIIVDMINIVIMFMIMLMVMAVLVKVLIKIK